jgi:Amino acid kinase family
MNLIILLFVIVFVIAESVSAFTLSVTNVHRPTFRKNGGVVVASSSSSDDVSFADSALTVAGAISTLRGKTIVVKYGGNAMTSEELKDKFCEDVAALQNLGIRVVVVHGGGPQINKMLEKVGVES